VDHPEWFVTRWITGGPRAGTGVGTGIALIAEPGHVNSYLVVGSRRALLFDSGMGMRPILPVLERMASHHAAPDDFYLTYRRAATRAAELFERFAELDRSGPFTLTPDQHPRPLPPLDRWRIPAVAPTRALADGESIDLGDRTVTVLHTPGHSPDSLCLWDAETRTLLSGDTVLSAAYWAHQPGADVAVFARSLGRLAELPLHRVLVAHNLRAELDVYAVHRAARAMYAVAEGHTRPRPDTDLLDRPVDRHELHGITVFTTPDSAAPASGVTR